MFDILCAFVSTFTKSVQISVTIPSVQFVVYILVMNPSDDCDRFLCFPFGILVNLIIVQRFIVEKLLEAFLFTNFHFNIAIKKPSISVDEPLTWLGAPNGCIGLWIGSLT